MNQLYGNIGKKIKGLAFGIFFAEAIASFFAGVAILSTDEDLIGVGILVMLLGPIVAWISSWLLYGFGDLIETNREIEYNTRKEDPSPEQKRQEFYSQFKDTNLESILQETQRNTQITTQPIYCKKCGEKLPKNTVICDKCGTKTYR